MSLTIQALKWMIGLAVTLAAFQVFLATKGHAGPADFISTGLYICSLLAFYWALRKPIKWVVYIFGIVCIFDFFDAITSGFTVKNSFNLLDAILSFVAICGIVIWMREAADKQPNSASHADLK
jgi:hypothetical protein